LRRHQTSPHGGASRFLSLPFLTPSTPTLGEAGSKPGHKGKKSKKIENSGGVTEVPSTFFSFF
jgi:hypothetical protein